MPDTEQCVLGAENKVRIEMLEKAIGKIEKNIDRLTNHYSKRPQWWVTILLTGLCTLCTGLIVYLVTCPT